LRREARFEEFERSSVVEDVDVVLELVFDRLFDRLAAVFAVSAVFLIVHLGSSGPNERASECETAERTGRSGHELSPRVDSRTIRQSFAVVFVRIHHTPP